MIQWQKYFDKIVCINYVQYTKRRELLEIQLKRVGILDCPVFEWYTPQRSQKETAYKATLDPTGKKYTANTFSCIMAHNKIIKDAYDSGLKNVLIMEDDIRFLRDLELMEKMLQAKPSEDQYDIIQYDKLITRGSGGGWAYTAQRARKEIYLNEYYFNPAIKTLSKACYCLSRHGMSLILQEIEEGNITTIDIIINSDKLKPVIKKISNPHPMAVQVVYLDAENFVRSHDNNQPFMKAIHFQQNYKYQEVNWDRYMMRADGSEYGYGSWVDLK